MLTKNRFRVPTWKLYLGKVLWKRMVWKRERTASCTWRVSTLTSNTCNKDDDDRIGDVTQNVGVTLLAHLRPGVHAGSGLGAGV